MSDRISKYLKKQSTLARWPLQTDSTDGIEKVVVIPSLAENPNLFDTLEDLSAGDPRDISSTLVLVVVNNREVPHSPPEDLENNRSTLAKLSAYRGNLRLGAIDASSPGNEIPPKEGVGLARKIGMDWGLSVLAENGAPTGPLLCLDADTRVERHYLSALGEAFENENSWAAVVDYAHPLDWETDIRERNAIVQYELFLRYHETGLAYADSPYAFPTVGSAMACTGEAYAAVSGMRRTRAGEDFYFLQALAKSGPIERIRSTTVYPSIRPSHRVPFGTGRTIQRFLDGDIEAIPFYRPEIYSILGKWLNTVEENLSADSARLLALAEAIEPKFSEFLSLQDFSVAWERIGKNSKTPSDRSDQFHRWFDAFRTLKSIHRLRDNGFPDAPAHEAAGGLVDRMTNRRRGGGKRSDPNPLEFLKMYRDLSRDLPDRAGLGGRSPRPSNLD